MVCKKCGKNLLKVRDLTEDEMKNIVYLESREQALWMVANTLLDTTLNKTVKKYHSDILQEISCVKVARVELNQKILENDKNLLIIDGGIYKHE